VEGWFDQFCSSLAQFCKGTGCSNSFLLRALLMEIMSSLICLNL